MTQNAIPSRAGRRRSARRASRAQTLAQARRGLRRRGPPAARRRPRGHAPVRHRRRDPGSPTSSRPPGCPTTPSTATSRRRTRWSPPSSRTAPSGCAATSRTRWPRGHRPRRRSGAGSRACSPRRRRRHRRDHPRRALERRQPGQRLTSGPPLATGPLAALLHEPFADLGSPDPELDASLAAHATVGMLADWLWKRSRPTPSDIERVVAFCLAGRA